MLSRQGSDRIPSWFLWGESNISTVDGVLLENVEMKAVTFIRSIQD